MSDGFNFITPILVDSSGFTNATWTDIDIDDGAYSTIPATATGVYLLVESSSATNHIGVRNKNYTAWAGDGDAGSSVARKPLIAGLDSANVFQAFATTWSSHSIYIIGYWGSAGLFHSTDYDTSATAPDEITPGSSATWTSTDITAHVDTGTAVAAILYDDNTNSAFRICATRDEASTQTGIANDHEGPFSWVSGVDGNEKFKIYVESNTDNNIYLIGYMTDGYTSVDHTSKAATVDDTWQTKTSDGTTSAIGSMMFCQSGNAATIGIRKTDATTQQPYADTFDSEGIGNIQPIENNASGQFDVLRDTSGDVWLETGYFTDVSAAGATGTVAVTESADTCAASGTQSANITGTVAKTESADTSAGSGTVSGSKTGTVAVTESADTCAASGTSITMITGTLATTNADDTGAASGTVTVPNSITGTIGVTEQSDTISASGIRNTFITGTVGVTERADTLSTGSSEGVLPGLTGRETPGELRRKRNQRFRQLNSG